MVRVWGGRVKDLRNCKLCAWECGVDRLEGERGVCRVTEPVIAAKQLHPAPPASYTVFMTGCNYRCLNCQNWDIAHYPDNPEGRALGYQDPKELAVEAVNMIETNQGRMIGADRIFFSGGEPTVHLPYIEQVVEHYRNTTDLWKVNFDTNGFATRKSMRRIVKLADSITFDFKAYSDPLHRAITGAPVEPVLRNLEFLIPKYLDKIWEVRILLIPRAHDLEEIRAMCEFLADLDESVPVCFLAFRPNFVLERHPGTPKRLMERAVEIARECGLHATWSGMPGINGSVPPEVEERADELLKHYDGRKGAALMGGYARVTGCGNHPRDCLACDDMARCPVKRYVAVRRT